MSHKPNTTPALLCMLTLAIIAVITLAPAFSEKSKFAEVEAPCKPTTESHYASVARK